MKRTVYLFELGVSWAAKGVAEDSDSVALESFIAPKCRLKSLRAVSKDRNTRRSVDRLTLASFARILLSVLVIRNPPLYESCTDCRQRV